MKHWDIFYDECKKDGYWHCFLLVPKDRVTDLRNLLLRARHTSKFMDAIHYKNIRKKMVHKGRPAQYVELLLGILGYILQQRDVRAALHLRDSQYGIIYDCFGAKLAVLRDINNKPIKGKHHSFQKRVEATFRMGLKGGLHYLFKGKKAVIDKIYVDFDKDSFKQSFDGNNLWERLKGSLNKNISFTSDSKIVPFGKKQYQPGCEISEIMQFVDVILGAFRTVVIQDVEFVARYKITEILRPLLKRNCGHPAWKKNSRYWRGFTLSDSYVDNGNWRFKDTRIEQDRLQLNIFEDLNYKT